MFTSEDFVTYFTELEMVEKNTHDFYQEVLKQLSDVEAVRVFKYLVEAEAVHMGLAEEIKRIAIRNSLK